MKILDDGPADAGAHAFAVELETGDEPDGAEVRELWASATDTGEYGVPHRIVRCGGGKADLADVRATMRRFQRSARRRLALDRGRAGGVPAARLVRHRAARLPPPGVQR